MVVGPCGVGKSSVILRYIYDKFVSNIDPTSEDIHRKVCLIDSTHVALDIFDSCDLGDPANTPRYLQSFVGFVCVYSISDDYSLESLKQYIDNIKRACTGKATPFIVIGNKCDLECDRKVTPGEGLRFAANYQADGFYEVSAKYGINISEVMDDLARKGIRNMETSCLKSELSKKKCAVS